MSIRKVAIPRIDVYCDLLVDPDAPDSLVCGEAALGRCLICLRDVCLAHCPTEPMAWDGLRVRVCSLCVGNISLAWLLNSIHLASGSQEAFVGDLSRAQALEAEG
jgi:hypothetical protein